MNNPMCHSIFARRRGSIRGGLMLVAMCTAFPVRAQFIGHPPMPDESLYVHCGLGDAGTPFTLSEKVAVPSAAQHAELDQLIALPAPLEPIHLMTYVPRAVLEQDVVPAEGVPGHPAIRLSVDGRTQSHHLWLVADDMDRNRLTSMIGTWRYMTVSDQSQRDKLFAQFKAELSRTPRLVIRGPRKGAPITLEARPGAHRTIGSGTDRIQVLDYFPYFGMDDKTKLPVNRSDERVNPAALIEIEGAGRKVRRWVFAKFPDFKQNQSQEMPYHITLDAPVTGRHHLPDYALVTVGLKRHEVWCRYQGECTSEALAVGKKVDVKGRNFTFDIASFVPSGRLVESYTASDKKGAVPALRLETTDGAGARVSMWLEPGKERIIPTKRGPLRVLMTLGPTALSGGHP